MWKLFICTLFLTCIVCVKIEEDCDFTSTSTINEYYVGYSTNLNSNTVTVLKDNSLSNDFSDAAIMIIQMQAGIMVDSNDPSYGGLSALPSTINPGFYEFNVVTAVTETSSGNGPVLNLLLKFSLLNNYSAVLANERFQVIIVPVCYFTSISETITGTPWNGNTGGVLALLSVQIEIDSGAFINLDGTGYRGGLDYFQTVRGTAPYTLNFVDNSANDQGNIATSQNAIKGEGIFGSPRFYDENFPTLISNYTYSNGDCASGAPGNAGGGGNQNDAGGGGGANYGRGGSGKIFQNGNNLQEGIGGASVNDIFTFYPSNQLFMGL